MARMPVPKMVKNGIYSPFMILGQLWASHFVLIFMQYPPFSNLQMCRSFWKVRLAMVVCGSVSAKATLRLVSGGEEYAKLGLPELLLSVLALRIMP
jgi:hypothetical protein